MKRYFKKEAESALGRGIAYVEFDDERVSRQVEIYSDRWFCSTIAYHPEIGPPYGGPMKNVDLGSFSQKMQRLQVLALQDDRPLYFAYDASSGPISSQLTAIAERWGATVIPFIP